MTPSLPLFPNFSLGTPAPKAPLRDHSYDLGHSSLLTRNRVSRHRVPKREIGNFGDSLRDIANSFTPYLLNIATSAPGIWEEFEMTDRESANDESLNESGKVFPLVQIVFAHLVMFALVTVVGGFATRSYIEHEQLEVAPVWSMLQVLTFSAFPLVSGWLIWNGYRQFARWTRLLLTIATCMIVWQVSVMAYVYVLVTVHVELGGTL